MKKNFVLDTNVLLSDDKCVSKGFDDNHVIIPLSVIEELDNKKNDKSEVGYAAREVLRDIDSIKDRYPNGNIKKGIIRNEKGGLLRIIPIAIGETKSLNKYYSLQKNDDYIILTALKVMKESSSTPTILVTNDKAMKMKALMSDLQTEVYKTSMVNKEFLDYSGYRTSILPLDFFGEFINGEWKLNEIPDTCTPEELNVEDPVANEFVLLDVSDEDKEKLVKKDIKKLKAIYRYKGGSYVKRDMNFRGLYGNVSGRNLEQSCALDLLMDDDVKVVSLRGNAGSGKTFLALSTLLTRILKDKNSKYDKIILLKPTVSISQDIGFLPGTADEKLNPFIRSFVDNFEVLRKKEVVHNKTSTKSFEELKEDGKIEIECISFLRGRSLNDCLIIADELQNVSHAVVKTILSRVGENTKIVALGDIDQIDVPYLSKFSNGLSHLGKKFRGQDIFGHITLVKSERSAVASLAAELL